MMKTDRFLNIYGWALIGFSAGGLYSLYALWSTESPPADMGYFGITITLWYLVTGIGILKRKDPTEEPSFKKVTFSTGSLALQEKG
jgi:hypothetical protein